MASICIHDELKADPKVLDLSKSKKTELSFSASDPSASKGRTSVDFRIDPGKYAARFLLGGELVYKINISHDVTLTSTPQIIKDIVFIDTANSQKPEEKFKITAQIEERDKNGKLLDYNLTSCSCAYIIG